MEPVTAPEHLVIASLVTLTIMVVLLIFSRRINKSILVASLTFCISYLFVVTTAIYDDIERQEYLNQFDLNKDGVFSGDELTPEYEEAMSKLINDVGRNLSFITGGIFGLTLALPAYIFSRIFIWVNRKKTHNMR